MKYRRVGTFDSIVWHCGALLNSVQRFVMLLNVPSFRTTPPSDPTHAMAGFFGWKTTARTSTCESLRGFWLSRPKPEKLAPASVDRIVASPNVGVATPPTMTVSGWLSG